MMILLLLGFATGFLITSTILYFYARKTRRAKYELTAPDRAWFHGKQWTKDEKAALKAQDQPPLTINRIQEVPYDTQEGK